MITVPLLYTLLILMVQLVFCVLLYKLTKDKLTWGLLVAGSCLSISARLLTIEDISPIYTDCLIASAITLNTLGFIFLFRLLKTLNCSVKQQHNAKF